MNLSREYLLSAFPESTEMFDLAVDRALDKIRLDAALQRERARHIQVKRVLGWGLALLLLLAGMLGVAEGVRRGVFDFLIGREDVLPQATELTKTDTATLLVGDTMLRVTDSVFDGATLRFVMSVQCQTMDRPITEEEMWDPDSEFGRQLQKDGVIAMNSFDWFTVDGVEYTMTSGSGGENAPGMEDGEALIYFELKLTSTEGVEVPEGDFTVGLPVIRYQIHGFVEGVPRMESRMFLPVKPLPMDSIRDVAPEGPQPMGQGTATIIEARLSPIKVYTTLRIDIPPSVPEQEARAYIDAWGEYALVDKDGNEVCPAGGSVWGWGVPYGETDASRHLWIQSEFPPAENYPEEIYLAPVGFYAEGGEWGADMDMAVKLK